MRNAILSLISLSAFAGGPVFAQQGTIVPYGGSVFGGPPAGYSFQYQDNSAPSDIARQELQRIQQPQQSRFTTCTTFGNQTTCY